MNKIVIADKADGSIVATVWVNHWIVGSFFLAFSDELIPL